MELSIIHDLAESIVGDITPQCGVSSEEKRRREEDAMKLITELMPTNSEYMRQLFHVSLFSFIIKESYLKNFVTIYFI